MAKSSRPASHLFDDPWPLERWPDVPTRFLLCRDDRFFPADFQRRVVRDRLGIDPDEMSGGHLPFLAQPDELVDWLEADPDIVCGVIGNRVRQLCAAE